MYYDKDSSTYMGDGSNGGYSYHGFQWASPPPRRRKRGLSGRGIAILLAFSILFSGAAGFGGGVLASQLTAQPQQTQQEPASSGLPASTVSTTGQSTSGSGTLSVTQIAELTADSVVEIQTQSVADSMQGQYVTEGAGSGVIVTQDGYIVTNNHVIEGATSITVRTRSGETYTATLVGTDEETDLAVIKVDVTGLQPAVFGDSDALSVGDLAVAIGNPLGELGGTVTDGIISALDREIDLDGETMNLLQTNAAINPGNSGGGLFNGNGELVGIVVAKSSGSGIEGLGFAIPINDAKTIIEELMDYGYVRGRVNLGLTLADISSAQMAMLYRVRQTGVYVAEVQSGSAAQQAGIAAGDRIVSIDGNEIGSSADLSQVMSGHSVGDTVTLVVDRNSRSMSFTITLTEYVPA